MSNNVISMATHSYLKERADAILLMWHDSDSMDGWLQLCGTRDLAANVLAMLEATPACQIGIRDIDRLPDGMSISDFYETLGAVSDDTGSDGWFKVSRQTAIEVVKHLIALHYDRLESEA